MREEGGIAIDVDEHATRFTLSAADAIYRVRVSGEGVIEHAGLVPAEAAQLLDITRSTVVPAAETEVSVDDEPLLSHHGPRWIGSGVTTRARYRTHRVAPTERGLRLEIDAFDAATDVLLTNRYDLVASSACIERSVGVRNLAVTAGEGSIRFLELVASAALRHLPYRDVEDFAGLWLHTIGGGWCWEGAARAMSLPELGLFPTHSMGAHRLETVGSWTSKVAVPLIALEDRATGRWWGVQLDHSGSWRFEIGADDGRVYVHVGLGSWVGAHWRRHLGPGDQYWSPTAVLATAAGDRDDLLNLLHGHRSVDLRRRRQCAGAGDALLPVVYNEFFASMGDPTEDSVRARIAAVADTGVDIFVIDGGWHAPPGSNTSWWDTVGDWHADGTRFPDGLAPVALSILSAGLVPGIWIEIESAGAASRLRMEHPSWLMARGSRLVEDNGRFFLDLGNPEAWAYAREVFERLWDTGFRYFKIDHNVDCSIGCDRDGSPGEGLVQHVDGLRRLVDDLRRAHAGVIIESCASGGNRLDGMWRHADLFSITDHGVWDGAFHTFPALAYGVSLAVHPSQMGLWAGLDGSLTHDEIAFRLVAPLVGRVHLTGRVETLDAEQRDLMMRALAFYRRWRSTVASSVAYHHRGPSHLDATAGWLAYEVAGPDASSLLAVWRRDDPESSLVVQPRGIDPRATYELEWFPSGRTEAAFGSALAAGIRCELQAPFTAAVVGMRRR